MTQRALPQFERLADFVGDLRSLVFPTQPSASRYFGLSHTTILRYERGDHPPPLGYLANLAKLIVERIAIEEQTAQRYQQFLLREINEAVAWCYADKRLFLDWDALSSEANSYLSKQQKKGVIGPYSPQAKADWGDAPNVGVFYGRETDLTKLKLWIINEQCRLIGLFGMGGIGKTVFAKRVAEDVSHHFNFVIWRSLKNAPPVEIVLKECLQFFSQEQDPDVSSTFDAQKVNLLRYLQQYRCLLILDNIESILQSGEMAGHYRDSYERYGQLIQMVGSSDHQSCLLLTSREKPKEFTELAEDSAPTRFLFLDGLTKESGQQVLKDKGLSGSEVALNTLIERCSGNPQILLILSEEIHLGFGGNVDAFLRQENLVIVGDSHEILARQFRRFSRLQQDVLVWLAILREATTQDKLTQALFPLIGQRRLREAVLALYRRSLVQRGDAGFFLQNVVMEYVTDWFIDQICQELTIGRIDLFDSHALIQAEAEEYVRESQIRMILRPITERLLANLGQLDVVARLKDTVAALRQTQSNQQGYAAGNILNLLVELQEEDLVGCDFSYLSIRQAYLQGAALRRVNFTGTRFIQTVFTQPFGSIVSIAVSKDGHLVAAGTANGDIYIWQVTDGQLVTVCRGHYTWVRGLAFHPNDNRLASASSDYTIRLWDSYTGRCLNILQEHTNRVRGVAFTPDGRLLLSASSDRTIKLWDSLTGQCLRTLTGHTGWIRPIAVSRSGNVLASGSSDQTVRLWGLDTGELLRVLLGHSDEVSSIAFSPTEDILISGSNDHTVRLWDALTGECLQIFQGHTDYVQSVALSPDGHTIASSSKDKTIRLWDRNNGKCRAILQGHTGTVEAVIFTPNNDGLVSGSSDLSLRFWDADSGKCLEILRGYINRIWVVAFSPDGRYLVGGASDQLARLWEVGSGRYLRAFSGHTGEIESVAFSPDGQKFATASSDESARLWDMQTGDCLHILRHERPGWVEDVAFSSDGLLLASAGEDQTVHIWDVHTGQRRYVLEGHTNSLRTVAFQPQGRILASGGDDKTIKLWDIDDGRCCQTLEGFTDPIWALAFSPNGEILAAGSHDKTIRLWNMTTNQWCQALNGHTDFVISVAFYPSGHKLVSSSFDKTVRVWDISTGECLQVLQDEGYEPRGVAISSDGCLLATGSGDSVVVVWNTETGKQAKPLRADRPYEDMVITSITGLTEAQKAALKVLGATEK